MLFLILLHLLHHCGIFTIHLQNQHHRLQLTSSESDSSESAPSSSSASILSSSESAAAHHHHLNQHQQRASQHSREHPSHMALSKSTSCMVIWFLFIDSLEFRIVAQLRPPRNCPRTPCCSFYCMSQSIVPVKTINGVGWSAR